MSKNILITGANGQLGTELNLLSIFYPNYNFIFTDYQELSIINKDAIDSFFENNNINFCVNCAAYTAVDKAETDIENANLLNGYAVGYLANACKKHNALFIHISTDYVFDGTATEPYKINHDINPINIYGASKYLGEQEALSNNTNSIIIRTSWVYSHVGNNFVKTMLRLMQQKENINVIDDQIGRPTYAADLANAIMQIISSSIINKNIAGIYHYSNEGIISWYNFANAIKELTNSTCKINPIPTSQYPTPAKRPHYSVLDTQKIVDTFKIEIPFWKDSLKKCLILLQ